MRQNRFFQLHALSYNKQPGSKLTGYCKEKSFLPQQSCKVLTDKVKIKYMRRPQRHLETQIKVIYEFCQQ
jgi:hypothetical protein